MARMIWSSSGNPTARISGRLGIARWQLRAAIHTIKNDAGLSPRDRVSIWDDGSVTDDTDVWIGNVYDEI